MAASLLGNFYARRFAATKSRYKVASKADDPRGSLSLFLTIGCLKTLRKLDVMALVLSTASLLLSICLIGSGSNQVSLFQHF